MDRYVDGSDARTEASRLTAPMDGPTAPSAPTPWIAFYAGGFAAVLTHWGKQEPAPAGCPAGGL